MGRNPCCAKAGLNRGAWTAMEDKILTDYIKAHGEGKWRNLPIRAGLKRCGKSCRLRWLNYLNPDIKRGNITRDEEDLIIRLHKLLGNRWSLIAGRLPGRTDNEIKNYWNTNIGKRFQCGINHAKNTSTTCATTHDHQAAAAAAADQYDHLINQLPAKVVLPPHVVRTKATRPPNRGQFHLPQTAQVGRHMIAVNSTPMMLLSTTTEEDHEDHATYTYEHGEYDILGQPTSFPSQSDEEYSKKRISGDHNNNNNNNPASFSISFAREFQADDGRRTDTGNTGTIGNTGNNKDDQHAPQVVIKGSDDHDLYYLSSSASLSNEDVSMLFINDQQLVNDDHNDDDTSWIASLLGSSDFLNSRV